MHCSDSDKLQYIKLQLTTYCSFGSIPSTAELNEVKRAAKLSTKQSAAEAERAKGMRTEPSMEYIDLIKTWRIHIYRFQSPTIFPFQRQDTNTRT